MRWSDEAAAVAVRAVLGDSHRADAPAPPNFGVAVGGTVDGVTTKHTLYRANRRTLRTASAGRIARAVVRGLAEHAMAVPEPDHLDFESFVMVRGDTATLVDRRMAWVVDDGSARVAKAGWRVVDTGIVRVDLSSAEVDLGLSDQWDAHWRRVDVDGDRPDRLELRDPAERYPLAGLIVGGIVDRAVPPVVSAMSLFAGAEPVPLETVERWIDVGADLRVSACRTADEILGALTA